MCGVPVRVFGRVFLGTSLFMLVCANMVKVSGYAKRAATRARLCSPVYLLSTEASALVRASLFVFLTQIRMRTTALFSFVREGTAIQAWLVPWRHAKKGNAGKDRHVLRIMAELAVEAKSACSPPAWSYPFHPLCFSFFLRAQRQSLPAPFVS